MKPRDRAWLPAEYQYRHVMAMKALADGSATPEQQKLVLAWVIETAAETYGEAFRSDDHGGERETAFALGRAYVGRQIVKLVNLPPAMVAKLREQDG